MSNRQPAQESRTSAFLRSAGEVRDPDHKLWGPAKWIAAMVQYLIALVIVMIGNGFKAVISGQKPRQRRQRDA